VLQGYVENINTIIKEIQSVDRDEFNSYLSNWIDGNYGIVKVGKIDE